MTLAFWSGILHNMGAMVSVFPSVLLSRKVMLMPGTGLLSTIFIL
jgi:hypothetical protein